MRTFCLYSLLFCLLNQNQAQTVTDASGNVYSTISIGTQNWLKENLKTTKFNDGVPITMVNDNSEWGSLTTPGYCWYNDSLRKSNSNYGALYNWYSVKNSKLCPAGWHVPTDRDWATLIAYLGGAALAGGKLKESGTQHWRIPNNNANNESNFTALPGGYRSTDGTFIVVGAFDALSIGGGWWSSTEKDNGNAWGQTIYYNTGKIGKVSNLKTVGFSVRCLQDNE